MSSNLTNVYAYLRKTFLDVDMLFARPVSYVKTLVDAEKVIFLFKEVRFVVFLLNSKFKSNPYSGSIANHKPIVEP